jgi:hypothetical protein
MKLTKICMNEKNELSKDDVKNYKTLIEEMLFIIKDEPSYFPDENFEEDSEWDLAVKKKYNKTMNYITINIYK